MTEDQLRERLIGRRATVKNGALYIDGREVTTYAECRAAQVKTSRKRHSMKDEEVAR